MRLRWRLPVLCSTAAEFDNLHHPNHETDLPCLGWRERECQDRTPLYTDVLLVNVATIMEAVIGYCHVRVSSAYRGE